MKKKTTFLTKKTKPQNSIQDFSFKNWDGKDISDIPYVSKQGTISYDIEVKVRPLLQEWIGLKKQQNLIPGTPKFLAKNSQQYQNLNKQLIEKQAKITKKKQVYTDKEGKKVNASAIYTKNINNKLIKPVFDKFGGKARAIKGLKTGRYDDNNQCKWNYYTKKNKQFITTYSAPEIVKDIMTQNNLKNIKQLTGYLSKQQNSSYTQSQIKYIVSYVRTRALQSITNLCQTNKSVKHICSQYQQQIKQIFDNNKPYTFTIVGKKNPYTFNQMIETLKAVQDKMNEWKNSVYQEPNNNQVVVNNVLNTQQPNQFNNQDIQQPNVDTQQNQNNNNINEQQNNNLTEQRHQTQIQNIDDYIDPFFDDDLDNNRNNAFNLDFEIFDENVIQDNQGQQFYDDNLINLNNSTNQINNTNTMYPFITQGNNI